VSLWLITRHIVSRQRPLPEPVVIEETLQIIVRQPVRLESSGAAAFGRWLANRPKFRGPLR